MKQILLVSLFILFVGCGRKTETITGAAGVAGVAGTDGKSCHVEKLVDGAIIKCDDGSVVEVLNGTDGLECNIQTIGNASFLTCGESIVQITNSQNNSTIQGCVVSKDNTVITIDCGESQVSFDTTGDQAPINSSKSSCNKDKKKKNKHCEEE